MIKDWLSALLITGLVVLEIGGWAWLFNHTIFSRKKDLLPSPIAAALATLAGAHVYFVLSFLGFTSAWLHWFLVLLPAGYFIFVQSKQPLHLNAARFFSLLAWKRRGPWVILILVWFLLKTIDALVPMHEEHALSWNLLSAKMWFEDKAHLVQPLHPASLAGTLWEGWYYHILCLLAPLGHTTRETLVRTQITAQLFYLGLGVGLLIFLLAELLEHFSNIQPWTKKILTRHAQLPFSVFLAFAWVTLASHTRAPLSATSAWAAQLFFVSALVLCALKRFELAGFTFASALVVSSRLAWAIPLFVLAVVFFTRFLKSESKKKSVIKTPAVFGSFTVPFGNFTLEFRSFLPALAGFFLGFVTLIARNIFIKAPLLFPLLPGEWTKLGWFASKDKQNLFISSSLSAVIPYQYLLAAALCFVAYWVLTWIKNRLTFLPRGTTVVIFMLCALAVVRFPFHLVWQNLPYAFLPSDSFLTKYHPRFEAALWANLHLDSTNKVAWTREKEFFYVDAKSSTTSYNALLFTALNQSTSPLAKARAICDLGFRTLAWEEYRHGTEVNGLARWLQIQEDIVSHSVQETHFFDLAPLCDRPL